jgi:hypothetical protein
MADQHAAPNCFCAGTRLMTLQGEVPVETVTVGDLVVTLSGVGSTLKPVTWVGAVQVDLDRHADPARAAPIRICAGAVEPGMPIRDLLVSPDHGIALEDDRGRRVLVPALYLVNGATVRRLSPSGVVRYHHVELEAHDILMADGMAVESYLDTGNRAPFTRNVLAFRPRDAAPTADPAIDLLPAFRERASCVRLLLGEAAWKLHARVLSYAQEIGHHLTDDPDLLVIVDGVPADLVSRESGEYLFLLPAGARAVRLCSRVHVPADTKPDGGDMRRLGVPLLRVLHDGDVLSLEGPQFGSGFLPAEAAWRWTTGEADLTLIPRAFETTLELHIAVGWSRYWIAAS